MYKRQGAADAVKSYVESCGGTYSAQCASAVEHVSRAGGTPLLVARDHRILGVIHLKDIVKQGIKENFADLRTMGIKTVMITGDNPMTAAAIAAEAGVDDFIAEATPETKLAAIRQYQAEGHMVAMTGDGTNDAPALAQADVAVALSLIHIFVAVVGVEDADIGDMVTSRENPVRLDPIEVEEPTMAVVFEASTSPLIGREGDIVGARQLKERLMREAESNISMRLEALEDKSGVEVAGRGVLHLSVLLEMCIRDSV